MAKVLLERGAAHPWGVGRACMLVLVRLLPLRVLAPHRGVFDLVQEMLPPMLEGGYGVAVRPTPCAALPVDGVLQVGQLAACPRGEFGVAQGRALFTGKSHVRTPSLVLCSGCSVRGGSEFGFDALHVAVGERQVLVVDRGVVVDVVDGLGGAVFVVDRHGRHEGLLWVVLLDRSVPRCALNTSGRTGPSPGTLRR